MIQLVREINRNEQNRVFKEISKGADNSIPLYDKLYVYYEDYLGDKENYFDKLTEMEEEFKEIGFRQEQTSYYISTEKYLDELEKLDKYFLEDFKKTVCKFDENKDTILDKYNEKHHTQGYTYKERFDKESLKHAVESNLIDVLPKGDLLNLLITLRSVNRKGIDVKNDNSYYIAKFNIKYNKKEDLIEKGIVFKDSKGYFVVTDVNLHPLSKYRVNSYTVIDYIGIEIEEGDSLFKNNNFKASFLGKLQEEYGDYMRREYFKVGNRHVKIVVKSDKKEDKLIKSMEKLFEEFNLKGKMYLETKDKTIQVIYK